MHEEHHHYDDAYIRQRERNIAFWQKLGLRPELTVIDLLQVSPGDRVLDAGCGTGSLAIAIADAGARVIGVDLSADAVERARAKAGSRGAVRFEVGDLDRWVPAHRFDKIVCWAVLEHFEVPIATSLVRKFRGWLRPGGLLLIGVPVKDRAPAKVMLRRVVLGNSGDATHEHQWRSGELELTLGEADLNLLRSCYFTFAGRPFPRRIALTGLFDTTLVCWAAALAQREGEG